MLPMLLLLFIVPMVYAESDSQRARDGFNDGSNAARTDVTFNPACDPTRAYTSDGQHSTIYCNSWNQGYTATWDSLHGNGQTDQTQTHAQYQQQRQNQHGNCIAVTCNIIQGGSQGQDQENNQGNTGP